MKRTAIQWISLGILIMIGPGISENMSASESAVQDIRTLVNEYNQQIEQHTDAGGREGPQKMTLSGSVVERAVGPMQKTITIYYDLNETMPEPGRFDVNAVSRKAIFKEQSAWKTVREYVYDSSGTLIFFFQTHDGPHDYPETRIYFLEQKPVRIVIDPMSPMDDGSLETDDTSEDRSGTRDYSDMTETDRLQAEHILADSQIFQQLAVLFGKL